MAARAMGTRGRATWLPWALLPVLAAAAAGSGSAPAPALPQPAQALHREQQARCLALQVAAVQAECLREADRELARRLAQRPVPAPPASRR